MNDTGGILGGSLENLLEDPERWPNRKPRVWINSCGLFWTNVASGKPPCAGCGDTSWGAATLRVLQAFVGPGTDIVVTACGRCWPAWPPALHAAVLRAIGASLERIAALGSRFDDDPGELLARMARVAELERLAEEGPR